MMPLAVILGALACSPSMIGFTMMALLWMVTIYADAQLALFVLVCKNTVYTPCGRMSAILTVLVEFNRKSPFSGMPVFNYEK